MKSVKSTRCYIEEATSDCSHTLCVRARAIKSATGNPFTPEEKEVLESYGYTARFRVVRKGYSAEAENYLTVTRLDACAEYADLIRVDLGTFSLERFCDWIKENDLVQIGGTYDFGGHSAWDYNPRDW